MAHGHLLRRGYAPGPPASGCPKTQLYCDVKELLSGPGVDCSRPEIAHVDRLPQHPPRRTG